MSVSPISPVAHSSMPEPLSMYPRDPSLLDAVAPDEVPAQAYHGDQRQQNFPVPTPKAFLPPPPTSKDTKGRRWSLASLFKDRRGSLTSSSSNNSNNNHEPSNLPPPPTPQASSNRQDRRAVSASYEPPSTLVSSQSHQPPPCININSNNNILGLPPIGKGSSRDSSNSQGGSRRSSLVDIPKFLSSLRRGSNSTSSESGQSPAGSYQPPSRISGFMARNSISEDHFYGGASGASSRRGSTREGEPLYPSSSPEDADSEDHEEDDVEYDAVFQGDDDPTLGPNVVAKLATLKPPPKDVYSQSRLPKSILKKGCITAAPGADASSTAGGPGQANRGASNSNNKNGLNASSLLSTASVHPMANDLGPNSLPPAASHRANLVTRSPVPNHQQQQQHIQQFQKAHDAHPSLQVPETSPAGAFHHHLFSPFGHHPSDSTHPLENHAWNAPWSSSASHQDHGAAIPANFHVGEVSPPGDRGGEPPLGDVQEKVISPLARPNLRPQGMGDPYANPTDGGDQQMNSGRQDNEHQLVMMMIDPKSYLNARAMNQIQGNGASYMQPPPPIGTIMGSDGQSSVYDASANTLGARIGMDQNKAAAAAAAAAATARRIGFLSTVEIIPAHRKSEYNRRSDKNATFKVLTPDMKGEIRDELNAYKMREMAVHVESMGNTAFH